MKQCPVVSTLGYPQPEVKWLQNEKLVSESSRVTMKHHDDGLCSLILADLEPSDSGVYVCKASNKLGEAMCSAKLKVEMWQRIKPPQQLGISFIWMDISDVDWF